MEDLVDRGEEIYQRIKPLLKGQEGKMIAIDVDSGEYFIADGALEACDLGEKKHPGKQFYIMRIGAKAAFYELTPLSPELISMYKKIKDSEVRPTS